MAITEVDFECPTVVGEGARGGQLPLPMQGKKRHHLSQAHLHPQVPWLL